MEIVMEKNLNQVMQPTRATQTVTLNFIINAIYR
jgi:hypothetical protein